MKEPIAWKDRNKSQAVLHCNSCYLLWYGVVGHVKGDDEQPRLSAALCSLAVRATSLLLLPSILPPFIPWQEWLGADTRLPHLKNLSLWFRNRWQQGKSPWDSQGAAGAGSFSVCHCGNICHVMKFFEEGVRYHSGLKRRPDPSLSWSQDEEALMRHFKQHLKFKK